MLKALEYFLDETNSKAIIIFMALTSLPTKETIKK